MSVTVTVSTVLALLTLVEQGVVTASRAKALWQQSADEGWDDARWEQELTTLADQSDAMYADTQAILDALAKRA